MLGTGPVACASEASTAAGGCATSPVSQETAPLSRLTQLQRGQREKRKDQGQDPETDDDLGFRPAHQLKVMMNGRHAEDALPAQLVRPDLKDHRNGFDHEDAADKRQQQLLLDDHGHGSDGAAEGERSYVAHKDLRRMRVVPEKTEAGANHGAAKY